MFEKGMLVGGNAAVIAAVPPLNHAAPAGRLLLLEELELVAVEELLGVELLDEVVLELNKLDAEEARVPLLEPLPPPQLLKPKTPSADSEPSVKSVLRRFMSGVSDIIS